MRIEDVAVSFIITKVERDILRKIADERGQTMSVFLKRAVRDYFKDVLPQKLSR